MKNTTHLILFLLQIKPTTKSTSSEWQKVEVCRFLFKG